MTCPDPGVLSQLLDDELAPAEAARTRAHVATCAACGERLAGLERASALGRRLAGAADGPAAPPGGGCPGAEDLAGWAERRLPAAVFQAVETHLRDCDACLVEAVAAVRATLPAPAPALAVPESLKARVASRWSAPEAAGRGGLVLRLVRAGVQLVDRHVVAPLLDVEAWAVPAPAVRAGEDRSALGFRIRAARAEIRASVVPEGDGVGVRLTLLDDRERALVAQRVVLRRHGRAMYSARTDAAGTVQLPRLEPGVYEVACPEIETDFRLDLRR